MSFFSYSRNIQIHIKTQLRIKTIELHMYNVTTKVWPGHRKARFTE